MRRICTDYEKEFIQNNSSKIISSTIEVKDNKRSRVFDNIFCYTLFIMVFFLVKEGMAKIHIYLCIACLAVVVFVVSELLYKHVIIKIDKKNLIKKHNLTINGATIVLINHNKKYIHIVEDDLCDDRGRPYRIFVPVNNLDLKLEERLISIISSDGSYFLMKADRETEKSIPCYRNLDLKDIATNNKWASRILPHPDYLKLDKDLRVMNEDEKAEFKKNYHIEYRKDNIVHKLCLIVICFVVTFVIADFVYDVVFYQNHFDIIHIAAAFVAIISSIIAVKLSNNKLNKKLDGVIYTQNIMISRWTSKRKGRYMVPILMVYMNQGGKLVEREYEKLGLKKGLAFGRIINMYTDGVNYYFI